MNKKKLRLLMIGAHPDDCDYLSGGTAAKFARLGHVVRFVSLTNGNTGHHEMGGGQLARIRAREASNAGKTAKIEYEGVIPILIFDRNMI